MVQNNCWPVICFALAAAGAVKTFLWILKTGQTGFGALASNWLDGWCAPGSKLPSWSKCLKFCSSDLISLDLDQRYFHGGVIWEFSGTTCANAVPRRDIEGGEFSNRKGRLQRNYYFGLCWDKIPRKNENISYADWRPTRRRTMGDWQRILFERRLLTWSSLLSVFLIVLPPLGISYCPPSSRYLSLYHLKSSLLSVFCHYYRHPLGISYHFKFLSSSSSSSSLLLV